MNIGSLFAGIGGIDLAFQTAGFNIKWQVEKDEFCQQVLAKNFPDVTRYGDIFDCHNLPPVDVITAGYPCQPFSVAGKREGRDDERFLIPEMIRIIREVQPYVVFLENVPGFATLNDGAEFKSLLRTFAEMGQDAEWGHLRASDIGAPHKRERWFLVAYANPERRRKIRQGRQQARERADGAGVIRHTQRQRLAGNSAGHLLRTNEGKRDEGWYGLDLYAGTTTEGNRPAYCVSQSRLGGDTHGLPYRLDRHQFPAPRNMPQYDWEPERTTDRKDHRRDRVKALGNAVVPQVIYPIALSIYEYLEAR